MDNYEKLSADPNVENCHPHFIAKIDGVRVRVATVVDEVVYLTDEGRAYLKDDEKPKFKRSKKLADEPVDDLKDIDLGE